MQAGPVGPVGYPAAVAPAYQPPPQGYQPAQYFPTALSVDCELEGDFTVSNKHRDLEQNIGTDADSLKSLRTMRKYVRNLENFVNVKCPERDFDCLQPSLPSHTRHITGAFSILQPPVHSVKPVLQSYLRAKDREKTYTCALTVMPTVCKSACKKLLHGMELVHTISSNDEHFRDVLSYASKHCYRNGRPRIAGQDGKLPWDLDVWYDPPSPMTLSASPDNGKPLDMQFACMLSGTPTQVLIDSGASHCFIDRDFVKAQGWDVTPDVGTVNCGGKTSACIDGFVVADVELGTYTGTLKFFVMDLPQGDFRLIPGQTWLRSISAVLHYGNQTVSFGAKREEAQVKLQESG